jgi:hypothetical protein
MSRSLEEVDRDEVIVRVAATPLADEDGPKLADEVLAAVAAVTREDPVNASYRHSQLRTVRATARTSEHRY